VSSQAALETDSQSCRGPRKIHQRRFGRRQAGASGDGAESEERKRELIAQAEEEARATADRASREAAAAITRADRDAKAVAQRRVEEAEQAIEAEQRKAFEAVRRDSAEKLGDTLEKFLRQELTDDQKRAYQTAILGEVKL